MTTLGDLLYGLRVPMGPQAGYALRRPTWDLYGGDPHHACHITAFCRNPLHPGPCKGWKKHLGILAPGALHALERIRHDKLEEQRKAKVKALMDAGHPVPKKLLTPIKYDPAKNKHLTLDVKDTQQVKQLMDSKSPITAPTKKEIEGKLADKHAAAKEAEKTALVDALAGKHNGTIMKALEDHPEQYERLDDKQKKYVAGVLDAKLKLGTAEEKSTASDLKAQLSIPDPKSAQPPPDEMKAEVHVPPVKQTMKSAGVKSGDVAIVNGKAVKVTKGPSGWDFTDETGKIKWGGGTATKHNVVKATPAQAADFHAKHGAAKDAVAGKIVADQAKAGPIKITEMHEPPGKAEADAFDQPFGPHPDVVKASTDGAMASLKAAKMAGATDTGIGKLKKLQAELESLHTGGTKNGKDLHAVAEATTKVLMGPLVTKTKANTHIQLSPKEQDKLHAELVGAIKGENGGQTPILNAIHAAWKDPNKKNGAMLQALGVDDPFGEVKGHAVDAPEAVLGGKTVAEHKAEMLAETHLGHVKKVAQGDYDANPTQVAGLAGLITKDQFDQDLSEHEQDDLLKKLHAAHPIAEPAVQDKINDVLTKLGQKPIAKPTPPAAAAGSDASLDPSGTPTSYVPMPVHPPHVFLATDYAAGIKSGTAKQKVTAYGKLKQSEFMQLTEDQKLAILGDLKKIEAKFLAPGKKAEAKAIHDHLLIVAATPPPAAPAKSVADQLAMHVGKLAVPAHLQSSGDATISNWLAGASFDNAITDADIDGDFLTAVDGSGDFSSAAELALKADFNEALANGSGTPGGLAGEMPGIVKQVSEGAAKIQGDMGWTGDSPALGAWKAATFKALVEKEMVGKPSGSGGAATPLPAAVADAVAPPKVTGALTSKQSDILKGAYKSLTGSYLKEDSAQANFDNLMAVAQVYSGHPELGGKITFGQVMNAIDQSLADQLGVSNAGLLATKIRDWLSTPGGKSYADNHSLDSAKVSKLTGGVQQAIEMAEFKKNNKHPVYPGPGAFDPSKTAADFRKLKNAESKKLQQELSAKLGKPFLSKENPGDPAYQAMVSYTGSGASSMNAYLRGESYYANDMHTALQAKTLENAMTPAEHDQLLWRRTGWEFVPKEYRSEAGIQKLIASGGTFHDKGFVSTTVAGQPGKYGTGLPVRLEIEAPAGTRGYHAQHLSQFPTENEYILGSGQTFQVLAVKKGGDHSNQLVIRVRVVTP